MSKEIVTSEMRDGQGNLIGEPAIVILRSDDETERFCESCKRTLPITYFGYTRSALESMPGVDKYCGACFVNC